MTKTNTILKLFVILFISMVLSGSVTILSANPVATTVLLEPVNHNYLTDPLGVFKWSAVNTANSYIFQISQDPEFYTTEVSDTTTQTTYKLKKSLLSQTIYYWRVKPLATGTTIPWSANSDFKFNPTISYKSFTGKFCPGYAITLSATIDFVYQTNNIFYLELSDANGEFSKSMRAIGNVNAEILESVTGNLPLDLTPSNKYKFRLRSTNPAMIYTLDVEDFVFVNLKKGEITNYYGNACPGKITTLYALDFPGIKTKWRVGKGVTIIGSDTLPKIQVQWPASGETTVTLIQYTNRGCVDSNVYKYYLNPDPISVSLTGDTIVCPNKPTYYVAKATGPCKYDWNLINGKILFQSNDSVFVEWTANPAKISIKVSNASGCMDSASMTAVYTSNSAISFIKPEKTCVFEEYTYKIYNPEKLILKWNIKGAIVIGDGAGDSLRLLITEPKCYLSFEGYPKPGSCFITKHDTIFSNTKPYPAIYGEDIVCVGKVYFYKTGHIDKAINVWTVINGTITGPTTGDSIRVVWNSIGECKVRLNRRFVDACDTSLTFTLQAFDKLEAPKITRYGDILTSNSQRRHKWFRYGFEIEGATTNKYTPIENGDYSCQIYELNLCESDTSNTISITNNGVEDIPQGFNIYPNPTNDKFTLEFVTNYAIVNAKICNSIGEVIYNKDLEANMSIIKTEFNLENYPAGVYYITINAGSSTIVRSVIKW